MRKQENKVISVDVATCLRAVALILFVFLNAPSVLMALKWLIGDGWLGK